MLEPGKTAVGGMTLVTSDEDSDVVVCTVAFVADATALVVEFTYVDGTLEEDVVTPV